MLLSRPNRAQGTSVVRQTTNPVHTHRNRYFRIHAHSGSQGNTRRDILHNGSLLGAALLLPSSFYGMIEPGAALAADTIHGAYGFEAEYRGEPFSFNQFEGKVTVIVNTASE